MIMNIRRISLGKGLLEEIDKGKTLCCRKVTKEDWDKVLKMLNTNSSPKNYFICVGEKQFQLIKLYERLILGEISENEYYVRNKAIINNAYIHPEWDYWSKPIAWRENIWKNFKTNEIVEVIDEDEYGEEILNIFGRREGF